MTRETKVGLLVGLGMILLIGIIVSDHLSVVSQQEAATLTHFADGAQRGLAPTEPQMEPTHVSPPPAIRQGPSPYAQQTVPLAEELRQPRDTRTTTDLNVEDLPRRESLPTRAYALHERHPGTGPGTAPGTAPGTSPGSVHDLVTRDRTGTETVAQAQHDDRLALLQQDGMQFSPVRHELDRSTYQVGSDTLRFNDAPPAQQTSREQTTRLTENTATIPLTATQPTMIVKSGQTLTAIARETLGNGNRWREIFELNRDKLDAPENLKAGMEIRLPRNNTPVTQTPAAIERTAATPVPVQVPSPQPTRLQEQRAQQQPTTSTPRTTATVKTYKVQQGDTLYRIAQKTLGDGNQWRKLYQANKSRIDDPDAVQVGLELSIPQS